MVTAKRSAGYGQLLLFVALLFGIVTMHTVGHPSEDGARAGHGSGHGAAMPMETAAMTGTATGVGSGHGATAATGTAAALGGTAFGTGHGSGHPAAEPMETAAVAVAATAHTPAPAGAMDPLRVCLAVLGVWGVALLATRLPARSPADAPPAGAARILLRALWPHPPPVRVALAKLSVLRI